MTRHDSPSRTDAERETPGSARCPEAPTVQDVYQAEMNGSVPEVFAESWRYLGDTDIDKERYYSKEFQQLEVDRVWSRTWQMACRLTDIPDDGDTYVYDIAGMSILLVRAGTEVRAFWNACLHRGTQLRATGGPTRELRCPYHGWAWDHEGRCKDIPGQWDLPHVDREVMCLPQLSVDTWDGFVFVHPGRDPAPLADQLAPVPEHFERWPFGERAKTAHVAKIFPANWKISMAAFMEGYHVPNSHPQGLASFADVNIQYDCYEQVSRILFMQGLPSPTLKRDLTEQEIFDATLRVSGIDAAIELPEGMTARRMLAQLGRQQLTEGLGLTLPEWEDADTLDIIAYYIFPNFVVWAGYHTPIVYRFTPYEGDPEMSVMETILFAPQAAEVTSTKDVDVHWLGPNESFTNAPELGPFLAPILDQDASNIAANQKGLHSTRRPGITLTNYQESLVRHHDEVLDRYIRGEM